MHAMTCFIKWSKKDQKVQHVWGLIQLQCCLSAGKVNMQQSKGVVTMIGHIGALE